jgi:hypothetical protein
MRQHFAKTPNSALVEPIMRGISNHTAAIQPEGLEGGGIVRPRGKNKFHQVTACGAPEILGRGLRFVSARDAAEVRGGGFDALRS